MFVVTTKRASVKSITSMIKFLQKDGYYLSVLTLTDFFFVRVETKCGANQKQLVS